jgi:2,3-bisphosphoglycerate-independent phosphoglycerate mutase
MYKPVVLIILDGWGLGKSEHGNAIMKANLPTIDRLSHFYPHISLQASGISVGLPWGEVGNSEVGHMTLGAGKIIYQNLPRITMAIQSGAFLKNKVFVETAEKVKKNGSALHLMGLVGKGGVHSYVDHLYALLELAKQQNLERVFIHVFTDGRDSSPTSAVESIRDLQKKINYYGVGKIASLCGRYFAMDRDNNWDRVAKAYKMMTKGAGEQISDPIQYLESSYQKEKFDEYLEPAVICENGQPVATIKNSDAVIFFNFREDRAKEMTKAFALSDFSGFERPFLNNVQFVTMVQYEEGFPVQIAFPPEKVTSGLGKLLSDKGLAQLRIAETEKFAHVTYFFNGGLEEPYPKENRIIIPSKKVNTFDEIPEMSAREITEKVIEQINQNKYDFILLNFANPDMVAHTGNEEATTKAAEIVDTCLGQLIPLVLEKGGCLLITADHGNAEEVKNTLTGETDTQHSENPVPLWFISSDNSSSEIRADSGFNIDEASGLLSDIAPTVLALFGIKKPEEMTGENLLDILK